MANPDAIRSGEGRVLRAAPVVRVASVVKRYLTDGPPALCDVTFDVRQGEFLTMVGPSGCGKTTLLRLLSGLTRASEGAVLLDGRPIAGPPPEVALVFQDYNRSLFPWLTVIRNVMFPLRPSRVSRDVRVARAETVLDELGLHGVARKYPWQLSGGMAQRVAIARAIVSRPRLLLLDEPFASVDALTRAELQDVVLRVHGQLEQRRMTVVHVTHDIDEAVYLGDRVLVLSPAPGRIIASIEVDVPRPREQTASRSTSRFLAVRNEAGVRALLLLCYLGAALMVCACGGGGHGGGKTPSRATEVNIIALPIEPTALAFYAKEKGFFRREGIDAKIAVINDPQQAPAGVLSGKAAFSSFSASGLALLKSRGAPVRLVAAGALYSPDAPTTALVTAKGKQFKHADELVGKTIAIDAPNTPAHIGLLRWLKRNGVDAGDVRFVDLPFPQMLGPLNKGRVDAAVMPEPFLTVALQQGAMRIAPIFDAVCARDCLATVWMARRDVEPNLAARFRKAIQSAAAWANQDENEPASGAILAKYSELDPGLFAKVTRTRFAERLRPEMAQPWIDVYAEFGVIPASVRATDLTK
jgi:NitT/TauT family transport system ATP-binding protein